MSCSKQISSISFAEIIKDRSAIVRTHESYIFAVDLATVMTGANQNYASQVSALLRIPTNAKCINGKISTFQVLNRLPDSTFPSNNFIEKQLSQHGGPKTKLVSFNDALQLIMVLPGKLAKETRQKFADILKRFMAGDQSMHDELDANAKSDSPIAQMARGSLQEDYALGFKRRREELELMKLEEEIKAMTQSRIMNLESNLNRISDPKSNPGLEERTRLLLKDTYMNLLLNQPAGAKTDETSSLNKPISIASVAAELGYKPTTNDAKKIGKSIKKAYVKKYGNDPPKHEQVCEGRVTRVNSYMERDRSLVEEALHAFFGKDSSVASNDSGI